MGGVGIGKNINADNLFWRRFAEDALVIGKRVDLFFDPLVGRIRFTAQNDGIRIIKKSFFFDDGTRRGVGDPNVPQGDRNTDPILIKDHGYRGDPVRFVAGSLRRRKLPDPPLLGQIGIVLNIITEGLHERYG